jgi:hypothetical protein
MNYQYARIKLSETTYQPSCKWQYLMYPDINQLTQIYQTYCQYKKFSSVMPLFESQITDRSTDVIGYFDQNQLVAFSLMKRYDQFNVLASQFAWTYHQPKQRLGIESLKTECAIYRDRGFEHLYLEQAHLYKHELQGFEILGSI